MLYALVLNGELVAVRNPGKSEAKVLDGYPLSPPDGRWTLTLAAACGFVRVVDVPPTLAAGEVVDGSTVELVDGVPTRLYTVRQKSQHELDAEAAAVADQAEREQAKQALALLQTFIDRGSNNTAAQIRDMTVLQARILKRLIRDSFGS